MKQKIVLAIAACALAVSCASGGKLNGGPDFTKIYPQPQMELSPSYFQLGGFYAAYPDVEIAPTKAPEGYEPFFITHYGRHGSRSQSAKGIYLGLISPLREADERSNLTEDGKEILRRAEALYAIQADSLGALLPRGYDEHRHIMDRICSHYPEIFSQGGSVRSFSTKTPRVVASMKTANSVLASRFPSLKISMDNSSEVQSMYFSREELVRSRERHSKQINDYSDAMDFSRLMSSIFNDPSLADSSSFPKIASSLWILSAEALLVKRPDLELFKFMTYDEAYALWSHRCKGVGMALGPSRQECKAVRGDVVKVVRHMIDSALEAIESDDAPRAVFHFGHDTQLVPIVHLLGIKGFSTSYDSTDQVISRWRDYLVSPMGGNVQMILFRKSGSDDVLVKFLVLENEVALDGLSTDCWPFYHWSAVEPFLESRMQ